MPTLPFIPDSDVRRAEVTRRVQQGLRAALFGAEFSVADALSAALESANSATAQQVIAFAEALGQGPSAAARRTANHTLGVMMADSVIRSYRSRKGQMRHADYSPPRRNRFANGRLEAALADQDNIFRASAEKLEFINEVGLTRAARQWARLNWGAGDAGTGSLAPTEVRFSNLVIASIGLQEQARPAFGIPPGFWKNAEGKSVPGGTGRNDAFYPTRVGPMRPTVGIRAWNFLDAGTARLARELGPVHQRLFRDVVDASKRVGRPFVATVVRPGDRARLRLR